MKRFVVSLKSGLTFATPWTVAQRAPLSTAFPRQEYWSGLPFPSPGDLPDPGIKPCIGRQILYHWATREASMKRCSTLNGIRQRQMKTMNHHYTPIRKAKTQSTDHTPNAGEDVWQQTLTHCWWECKMVQSLWKTALSQSNILLP